MIENPQDKEYMGDEFCNHGNLKESCKACKLSVENNFINKPGRHTEKSDIVSSRNLELQLLQEKIHDHPELIDFEKQIYQSENIYLIPVDKKDEAERIAKQDFEEYLKKYKNSGATIDNVVEWSDTGLPGAASNKTHTYDTENEWNTWTVHAIVENNDNIKNDKYLPKNVIAYHELMHVEETPKGATSNSEHSPMVEVLPTINTIIQVDKIYKEIHGLDISEKVDYKRKIILGKNQVDIGQLANFYRNLESQYPNMGEAVVSPESLDFIKG